MRNPLAILKDPLCRRIWLTGLAINIMRWLAFLAYSLFALETTGSPFLVALTGFARLLPLLFAGVFSAWIEGIDRRFVMLLVMVVLWAIDLVMLGLALSDLITIHWLLLASLLGGIAWSFENGLRRAILADAAGSQRISESMGLEAVSNQATRMAGPAIGGTLIATIGLSGVFALGIALHGLGLLAMTGLPPSLSGPQSPGQSIINMLKGGLTYVKQHRLLQASLAITVIINLWAFPYVALAPVISERVLGLSPILTGLFLATEALGGLIASLWITASAKPRNFVPLYLYGALIFTVFTASTGLITSPAPAFAALFLAGLGMAGFNSMQMAIPLLATPPELRVRVTGLVTVCIGAAPFGLLHAGLLAEWLGAQNAQLIIGAEGLLATALAIRKWPEVLQTQEPSPA